MDFGDIFTYIRRGIMIILVVSGGWILLNWGYDFTTMDNPPTLIETAQNFIDYWSRSFSKIKIF